MSLPLSVISLKGLGMSLVSNEALDWMGIRVGCKSTEGDFDIERMILDSCLEFRKDHRLCSLIFSWIKVHGDYVVIEKLKKLLTQYNERYFPEIVWIHALAAFAVHLKMHKWKKLTKVLDTPTYLYDAKSTDSAIALKGKISWLEEYNFVVAQNSIRIREKDVLSPAELVRKNTQYKNRYLYGPSWRSDIIWAIEKGITVPAKIAKEVGCSYEPAYRISKEYILATG